MKPLPSPARKSGSAGLLHRNRDFRLLWAGQVVSVFGSQISRLAYPLLVLAMTGSAARAGVVGAVATVPYSLAQIPAGVLVDRWDRRRIMLACDGGRLVALGSIPLAGVLGQVTYAQVLVVAFVEGTLFVAFNLAERAGIPVVVGPDDLPAAVAQNEAKSQGANLAGPALSGVLFGVGRLLPFLADAVSYGISLITVALLRSNLTSIRPEPRHEDTRSVRRDLREGMTWLWRQPFLRAGAVLIGGVNPVITAVGLAVIVLARDEGASPTVVGVVVGCSGAGGLLGATAGCSPAASYLAAHGGHGRDLGLGRGPGAHGRFPPALGTRAAGCRTVFPCSAVERGPADHPRPPHPQPPAWPGQLGNPADLVVHTAGRLPARRVRDAERWRGRHDVDPGRAHGSHRGRCCSQPFATEWCPARACLSTASEN